MITVHSGKSKKNGSIIVTYSEDKKKFVFEETDAKPHPDLVEAMKALKVHAAIVSELLVEAEYGIEKTKDEKGEKIEVPFFATEATGEEYRVSGLHSSDKGVILTFTKDVQIGALNLNTPLINVAFESEAGYRFAMDLKRKTEKALKEFELYIGGKRSEEPKEEVVNKVQIALPLGEDGQEIDPAQRLAEVEETQEQTELQKRRQTAANPAGVLQE